MPQDNYRAVVFTALSVEYLAVAAFLTNRQQIVDPAGALYESGQFVASGSTWDVGIVELGLSTPNAAVEAERAIAFFNPHAVLHVGVAMGIKDVAIGDVVTAFKIYSYEAGKNDAEFIPRPEIELDSYSLQQLARAEARKADWLKRLSSVPSPAPKVFVAPIFSGQRVVASLSQPDFSRSLQSYYGDALAIELEGLGYFSVARKMSAPISAIAIRGISELLEGQRDNPEAKPARQKKVVQQRISAGHASAFAFQLLSKYVPDRSLTEVDQDLEPVTEFKTDEGLNIARKPHRAQCFTEPAIQLDLMLIPGGTFTMGSPPDELGRYSDEGPQHEVSIRPFLMGRYPITQAQWKVIADRTDLKVKADLDPAPSEFKGDDHPVEQVSWYEAVEFCERLSRLTSHTYRLPTEAEWEYACRAGTETPFHFGETITTDLANYRGKDREDNPEEYPGHYGRGPKGVYRQTTTPVNHFHPLANAFGLCDMHGNVWEWCLDHWHGNYDGAPNDGSAWLNEDEDAERVVRGGSWGDNPRYCRSACRYFSNPGVRYNVIGFRVICEAPGL